MAYTRTWNAANEASPADSDDRSDGAEKIRHLKVDIRERMEKDHYMDIAGADAAHGEHKQVTLRSGAAPTYQASKVIVYAKNVDGVAELFAKDGDGNEIQITAEGAPNAFASGTSTLFYQDTAPAGWTIKNTLNDKLVYITKGSAAGGEKGGSAHSTGTWTQPTHTHGIGSHKHDVTLPASGWSYVSGGEPGYLTIGWYNKAKDRTVKSAESVGATGSSASENTWRPAAYCCIIATKD